MIDPAMQKRYVEEHIPYRLSLLDSLCATTILLVAREHHEGGVSTERFLLETSSGIRQGDFTTLHNLNTEAGLVQARLLLEFLGFGIKVEDGVSTLTSHKTSKKDGDVRIDQIRGNDKQPLSRVSIEEVVSIGMVQAPGHDPEPIQDLLVFMLVSANKGATHLTSSPKVAPGMRWYMGAVLTRVLVEVFLYRRLQRSVPWYGRWTESLLHPELLAGHRECYASLYAAVELVSGGK